MKKTFIKSICATALLPFAARAKTEAAPAYTPASSMKMRLVATIALVLVGVTVLIILPARATPQAGVSSVTIAHGTFDEIDIFAKHRASGFGLEDRRVPGDGVVTGMGKIDGRDVVLFSHDASVFGGSLGEVFAEKVIKVMDLALRNRIPIIKTKA